MDACDDEPRACARALAPTQPPASPCRSPRTAAPPHTPRARLQIFEKRPTTVKNFGIWVRYQSRTGYHNMYKEYRDTTLNGAVSQLYQEMASRHRVRFSCLQIIKTATVPAKACKRALTQQVRAPRRAGCGRGARGWRVAAARGAVGSRVVMRVAAAFDISAASANDGWGVPGSCGHPRRPCMPR